jgi:hypothetical protein
LHEPVDQEQTLKPTLEYLSKARAVAAALTTCTEKSSPHSTKLGCLAAMIHNRKNQKCFLQRRNYYHQPRHLN